METKFKVGDTITLQSGRKKSDCTPGVRYMVEEVTPTAAAIRDDVGDKHWVKEGDGFVLLAAAAPDDTDKALAYLRAKLCGDPRHIGVTEGQTLREMLKEVYGLEVSTSPHLVPVL